MTETISHRKSLSGSGISRTKNGVPGISSFVPPNIELETGSTAHKKRYSIMDKRFLQLLATPSPFTNSLTQSKIISHKEKSFQGESRPQRSQSRSRVMQTPTPDDDKERIALQLSDFKILRPKSQLKLRTPTPEKISSLKGGQSSFSRLDSLPKVLTLHSRKPSEGLSSIIKLDVSTGPDNISKASILMKKSTISAVQLLNKKHLIAQKIIREYRNEEEANVTLVEPRKRPQFEEEYFWRKKKQVEVVTRVELDVSLTAVQEALESAIQNARDGPLLYKQLEKAAEIAFTSKNGELYMAVLKTQGKVMLGYNDISKGIAIFKALKKVGETKKDYIMKLTCYKYLGRCFQMMGNHTLSIFYYTKFLQMAWYCNKGNYELRAYDLIGMQYFYLGDLERANFFHNKMMEGKIEAKDSDLRKLGISKLQIKMAEFANPQKQESLIPTVELELEGQYPPSEDDFELPPPDNQSKSKENREIMNEIFGVHEKSPPKKDLGEFKRMLVRKKLDHERSKSTKGMIRPRLGVTDKEQSEEFLGQEEDRGIIEDTGKRHLFLSHLSPNRHVKNFNAKDAKDVMRDYMTNGNGKDGVILGLDGKALDRVKIKIMKLKSSIGIALQMVLDAKKRK